MWFKKHTPEEFYDVAYQLIILPEHVYGGIPAEQMRTSQVAEKPIGSGRFRFVRWDKDTRIELVACGSEAKVKEKGLFRLEGRDCLGARPERRLVGGELDRLQAARNAALARHIRVDVHNAGLRRWRLVGHGLSSFPPAGAAKTAAKVSAKKAHA